MLEKMTQLIYKCPIWVFQKHAIHIRHHLPFYKLPKHRLDHHMTVSKFPKQTNHTLHLFHKHSFTICNFSTTLFLHFIQYSSHISPASLNVLAYGLFWLLFIEVSKEDLVVSHLFHSNSCWSTWKRHNGLVTEGDLSAVCLFHINQTSPSVHLAFKHWI